MSEFCMAPLRATSGLIQRYRACPHCARPVEQVRYLSRYPDWWNCAPCSILMHVNNTVIREKDIVA